MSQIRTKYPFVKLDEDVYIAITRQVADTEVNDFVNELLRKYFKLTVGQSIPKEQE